MAKIEFYYGVGHLDGVDDIEPDAVFAKAGGAIERLARRLGHELCIIPVEMSRQAPDCVANARTLDIGRRIERRFLETFDAALTDAISA